MAKREETEPGWLSLPFHPKSATTSSSLHNRRFATFQANVGKSVRRLEIKGVLRFFKIIKLPPHNIIGLCGGQLDNSHGGFELDLLFRC
ncbi:hypothetical protein Mapa_002406 [Marchantia paleacea]|nr:hypothetical protein Mapa_002406 [Marchantia paleacea]